MFLLAILNDLRGNALHSRVFLILAKINHVRNDSKEYAVPLK